MNTQTLAIRPDSPIFITTPLGLITLNKVEGKVGEGYRKLRIKMPKCMTAFVGDKPDLKVNEHVMVDKHGRVIPKFNLLAPVTNEEGELIGVIAPTALRLDESNATPVQEPDPEPSET